MSLRFPRQAEPLIVAAAFDNTPLIDNEDTIGVLDGGQAMGNDQGGTIFH